MRCPDCNKFVGLETGEPEAELDVEVADDNQSAHVTGTVRVFRNCADCGVELKETTFEIDEEVDLKDHKIDEQAEVDGATVDAGAVEATESGGGRYKKNMIGYTLTYCIDIPWKLGKKEGTVTHEETIEDSVQASAFDEMV
jgi:hypothetical protein